MPGATMLTYGLMHLMALPLPAPRFPIMTALAMFLAFFVTALGEELGWSGYVIDSIQAREERIRCSAISRDDQCQRGHVF
jgi:membrane protease YdiL (CAAX protease family)